MRKIFIPVFAVLVIAFIAGCTQTGPGIIPGGQNNVPANLQPGTYNEISLDIKEPVNTQSFASAEELSAFVKANRGSSNYYYRGGMGVDMAFAEGAMVKTMQAPMAESDSVSSPNAYSETNNQVKGVDEADTTKTDGEYVYTVSNNIVYIVKAYPGSDAEVVSKITFEDANVQGLFVMGNKLAVFGDYYNYDWLKKSDIRPQSGMTFFTIYDISDKEKPTAAKEFKFEGNYFNARMSEGYVYFVARSMPEVRPIPMPIIMEGIAVRNMPVDKIHYYNIQYNNAQFVTVHAIDLAKDDLTDSQTVAVEDSENMYMSADNIYITYTQFINEYQISQKVLEELVKDKLSDADQQLIAKIKATDDEVLSRYEKEQKIFQVYQNYMNYLPQKEQEDLQDEIQAEVEKKMDEYDYLQYTVVNKIEVSKGRITVGDNGKVPGRIMNQFSMDENGDNFRVATTVDQVWGYNTKKAALSTNNVYVLDSQLKTVGSLEGLAEGEQIYSTRFIGDRLYMVTFRQVDPFFVIDLSNPKKPKELGSLKIPGFSRYLHPYDSNTIIGIGQEATSSGRVTGLKISLFDVSDVSKPKELAKFVTDEKYAQSTALWDHKAFLFDKDKELLVIPVYNYNYDYRGGSNGYNGAFVFKITKDDIELRGLIDHSQGQSMYYQPLVERSLWINDLLYTKSLNLLRINRIDDLSSVKNISLDSVPTGIKVY